jgi:SecD/SecF fusion protein
MNDEILDPRLERVLRDVLAEAEPAEPPVALSAAVAAIPRRAPAPRWTAGRTAFTVLGLAAAVVVAVASIATALQAFGPQPPVGGVPTPGPGDTNRVRIEYAALPAGDATPGAGDLAAIAAVMQRRIASVGLAGSSVEVSGDRIVVVLGVDPTDGATVARLEALLGTTGRVDLVPLGPVPAAEGDSVALAEHPALFSGDKVASARIGADQPGQRTVDLTLDAEATALFADYTGRHIGEYFAILLDGTVLTAPVIQEAIVNGDVQITGGDPGGFPLDAAQQLVTILDAGALPFPVQEVSKGPAGPTPSS